MKYLSLCSILITYGFALALNPIKTVPWNNHVGAVSFTFDDGLENQVNNLAPILDTMPNVKVSFFLTGMSGDLKTESVQKGFAELSNNGHEIGNHSLSHQYLTNLTETELAEEISNYADTLETLINSAGANCKITSFATPYCSNNSTVQNVIAEKHFINRDCGWTGRNEWDTEPDNWFSFQAKTWTRSQSTTEELMLALDTAANIGDYSATSSWLKPSEKGAWVVVLNHGVVVDSDDYSIDPTDIESILNHAYENDMWIAPFGTVGAYYQAHFVLDTTTATKTDGGYEISWSLPQQNMPASNPIKVTLDRDWLSSSFENDSNVIIEQTGNVIWPDDQGIYTIEINSTSLTIRKASSLEIQEVSTGIKKTPLNKLNLKKVRHFDVKGRQVKD